MKRDIKRYRKANPVVMQRIVQTLVHDLGIAPDIHLQTLIHNWTEVVGATNARNTRPISLKNGILTVTVSSPAWNAQAQYYKASFLKNIKDFEPDSEKEIRDIRFVLERK